MRTEPVKARQTHQLLISELRGLGVSLLRALCRQEGIDSASFCDKQDFIDALLPLSAAFAAVAPGKFCANHTALNAPFSLVFLDVDGVLNVNPRSSAYCGSSGAEPTATLDPECMSRLVHLCTATDPQFPPRRLVLSSTWRASLQLKAALWSALVEAGLPHDYFVGQTPHVGFKERATEIKEWLAELLANEAKASATATADSGGVWCGAYVALDDMDLEGPELEGHFVWVDPEFGLSDANVSSAFACLRQTPGPS
jgi:hypothetical protein